MPGLHRLSFSEKQLCAVTYFLWMQASCLLVESTFGNDMELNNLLNVLVCKRGQLSPFSDGAHPKKKLKKTLTLFHICKTPYIQQHFNHTIRMFILPAVDICWQCQWVMAYAPLAVPDHYPWTMSSIYSVQCHHNVHHVLSVGEPSVGAGTKMPGQWQP